MNIVVTPTPTCNLNTNKYLRKVSEMDQIVEIIREMEEVPNGYHVMPSRIKQIKEARQIAMYFATEYFGWSLSAIGDYFGGREHSTVIHARDSVGQNAFTRPDYCHRVRNIDNAIIERFPFINHHNLSNHY